MIPLITRDLLTSLGECGRADLLLQSPACPPLPLPLADALNLMARHVDTQEYADLAPTMAGSARWLTASILSTAVAATPTDVLALHQPRLGIFVDSGGGRTVLTERETLTLILSTFSTIEVTMARDSHAMLMSKTLAVVRASEPSGDWFASMALVHPGAVARSDLDGAVVWERLALRTGDGGDWHAGGVVVPGPY